MASRKVGISIPHKVLLAEKTDEKNFAGKIRMPPAVKLNELGSLSSGRAADLAGMSRPFSNV